MTRHLLTRALCLFPLLAATSLHAEALLDFGDGNFIRGRAVELRDGTWRWQHGISGSEMEFPLAKVKRVLFSGETPPNPTGDILFLNNGDILSGSIQSLDQNHLDMVSPVLGDLNLERDRLQLARIAPRAGSVVFADGGDIKDWTLTDMNEADEWSSGNGVLRYQGKGRGQTLARDAKLPPSADISFELGWDKEKADEAGLGAVFSLMIAASDAEGGAGNGCYKIQFARSWATVEREYGTESGRSSNTLGRLQMHRLRDLGPTVRVRVVLDRPRKKIHLFLDGHMIGEVSDDSDETPAGTWLGFETGGVGNFRARRLRVETWNGFLGNKLATTSNSAKTNDLVIINSSTPGGDEIFGNIKAIREEPERGRVVEIAATLNPSKPLVIPVGLIAHLSFASSQEPGAAKGNSVILRLDDGAKVTVPSIALAEGVLRTDLYGRQGVEIPLDRVLSIEFARENEKPAADENENPAESEE